MGKRASVDANALVWAMQGAGVACGCLLASAQHSRALEPEQSRLRHVPQQRMHMCLNNACTCALTTHVHVPQQRMYMCFNNADKAQGMNRPDTLTHKDDMTGMRIKAQAQDKRRAAPV